MSLCWITWTDSLLLNTGKARLVRDGSGLNINEASKGYGYSDLVCNRILSFTHDFPHKQHIDTERMGLYNL